MLKKLREPWKPGKLKSVLATLIFALICVTFVFVGFNPRNASMGVGTVASVNEYVISQYEYQERVSMIENQMGSLSKLPAAQRQMYEKIIRQNALDELIRYELLAQYAQKVGVVASDAATRDQIVNISAFQENGRFVRDRHDQFLTYRNMSASEFEGKIRKDVAVTQLRKLFVDALRAPDIVKQYQKQVRKTKINVEFLKVDDEALKSLSSKNNSAEDFLKDSANLSKAQNYYTNHADEFTSKAEIQARHILIKGTSGDSLDKIKKIKEEVVKGDFAQLASKYSEDEGSKTKGGDLNFFAKGTMVKEFEDVAFSLPVGKVSEPVKTAYGYHLIKVEARRGGDKKPFDAVKTSIAERMLVEELKEKQLAEIDKTLREKGDISKYVSGLKLKWQETGDTGLTQGFLTKLEGVPTALEAALTLKKTGELYPQLIRSGADSYVIRLKKLSLPSESTDAGFAPETPVAASESLGLWAEELMKMAHVYRNNLIAQ